MTYYFPAIIKKTAAGYHVRYVDLQDCFGEGATLDEALDEVYGDGDEREEIDRLIRRSYAAKLENGKRDAVYAALCRRGFSPRTVREALNDWADAQQEGWDE